MRVARFLSHLAVVAVLLVLLGWPVAVRAADATPPDSSIAVSDSTFAAPDSVATIYLAKGDSLKVRYVGYWAETVRYQSVTGQSGYLTVNKIRAIKDQHRKDFFRELMLQRTTWGDPGPDAKGEFKRRSLSTFLTRPFRARPIRERRGYFLGEFGLSSRTGDGHSTGGDEPLYNTGVGIVKNLDRDWGLGGLVTLNTDGRGYKSYGAGVRLARYLNDHWTLNGTVGAFSDDDHDDRHLLGIQAFGEFAVTGASALSLFARLERHHYSVTRYLSFPFVLAEDVEVSENALHIGLRVGPRPGYLSLPGIIAGSLLMTSGGTRGVY
jgi:hypothetical protein